MTTNNNTPKELSIEIGGFGLSAQLHLINDAKLEFIPNIYSPDSDKITSQPSQKAWELFRHELDKLDVWKWEKEYWADVCDGTQWEVKIIWGDKRCISDGSNCYPGKDGMAVFDVEEAEGWKRFIEAVNRLFGAGCF